MKSMHLLLSEAESAWREEVKRDFPLRSDTPVIKKASQNGRDWDFSTDLKKIFAQISKDESLQKKFEQVIPDYWDGEPEELARETLHYLLHHELYHPLEAPFSVTGENNDRKRIHQSIVKGILQAEPSLKPLEQLIKVQLSRNIVEDFILDNRFYLDNKTAAYVREDIIPIWDLLELHNMPSQTNLYTITRFLYGAMYGPKKTHAFFEDKAGEKGAVIAEKALESLIAKPAQLPKKNGKPLVEKNLELQEKLQEYATNVRKILSGTDRYEGIKRFMAVLGPYVEKDMPLGRSNIQGCGSSTQDILQDLLDGMDSAEQAQFLQSLSQENQSNLEQAALQLPKKPTSPYANSSIDEMKNLDILAAHEFYKRNHPSIKIIGGKKAGESIVVGNQEYWGLRKSSILTEDQLGRVNLKRIDALQRRTRLPWLIDLGNRTFRLNEYELRQRDVKDIIYVDSSLDVPDFIEFFLDSSGSMFGGTQGNYSLNDGSRWDMLSYVFYGFVDALQQGGRLVGKQSKMRIHNFAESQVSSHPVSIEQFLNGNISALNILFKPGNGYGDTKPCIKRYSHNGKAAYVICTDGEVSNCEREARKMKSIAKNPNNCVILFEIGGTYELGNSVRNEPNIIYHQVHDKGKMLQAGLEVLLSR